MDVAKVFWTGRSQAVRLPKGYRFEDSEVIIRRRGATVILEPIVSDWAWLDRVVGAVDADFAEASAEQPEEQARASLDLFE